MRSRYRRAWQSAVRLFTRGGSRGARCCRDRGAARRRRGAQARALTPKQARALRAAVRGRVLTPGHERLQRRARRLQPPLRRRQATRGRAGRATATTCAPSSAGPTATTSRSSRRSGGHGYNGDSTSATRGRRRPRTRWTGSPTGDGRATIGPGARTARRLHRARAPSGVTIPAGQCPTVGVGGLVLGGGMGLAGRAFGLTLDRVTSFDVVTADGPAAGRGRRRPVLGPARRRRELRDRHRRPAAAPAA